MKPPFINIDASNQPQTDGQHKAVRIEHELLARPMFATAFRSPKKMNWKDAKRI